MRISASGISGGDGEVTIRCEGDVVAAAPQDTIASALVNAGRRRHRTAREGDDRGLFCGMGVCHECAMVVDGVPGRLACLTPVAEGMTVDRQPPRPALPSELAPELDEHELAPDVLVLGAGPAGMSAAAVAAEAGLSVIVIDERSKLGGQYFKQPSERFELDDSRLDAQYRAGRSLIGRVQAAGAQILQQVQVWGAFAADHVLASGPDARYVLRPRQLVLATGAYERGVPMPGWTLPGVMTTGAAQTLMRASQVSPGERVLVSGNGPLNMQVAAELVRAGVTVVALAELAQLRRLSHAGAGWRMLTSAPGLVRDGLGYTATLAKARVPVLTGTSVIRMSGDGQVRSATVARVDRDGVPVPGTERTFDVDAVCMGFGFLPSNEIARALGCRHRYDPASATLVLEDDGEGRTSVDNVWVAGDSAGIGGAKVAAAVGSLVGGRVARALGAAVPVEIERRLRSARSELRRSRRFQRALWSVYEAPVLVDQLVADDTLVCRCESVSWEDVQRQVSLSSGSAGSLKRLTRAGMGKCQGRYCGPVLTRCAERVTGVPVGERSGFAPQVPFKPTPVSVVAQPSVGDAPHRFDVS